ncbi:MAG: phosphatidate cytidylyltransferase [Kiritimatiellae bacterium]|nr:phosphatidate cytidylyltransferase [Kiritimatiellia bacterium]MDD4025255.1 phosphatidate cytidylyltransferase [Kiritimatiellia bacterium]MDD4622601.1 phosphatidate cytidylyltransferase [Kiritimatiellia bacterium]
MIVRRVVIGVLVATAWFLGLCYMPGSMLFLVLLLMCCACQYEFYSMMRRSGHPVSRNYGMVMGVVWLVACYAYPPYAARELPVGHQFETLVLSSLTFVLFLRVLFDARIKKPVEHAGVTLLGFFYIPFMLSFFIRLAQWGASGMFEMPCARGGVYLASYVAAVVKFGDIGGFTFGTLMGRHKLFSRVSPKKSWEGLLGGVLFSMAASVLMIWAARRFSWLPHCPLRELSLMHALALGVVLAAVGALGDLVESMFKRASGFKDSSGLLHESGGILDMFDSLVFTPAALYFYLAWFIGQAVCA